MDETNNFDFLEKKQISSLFCQIQEEKEKIIKQHFINYQNLKNIDYKQWILCSLFAKE